jgi:pyridoxamine 5'-phosphate oxidase
MPRFAEVDARFPGEDVPLPPHWGGYRLEPETVEFWKGRVHRLHDRFGYTRDGDAWATRTALAVGCAAPPIRYRSGP